MQQIIDFSNCPNGYRQYGGSDNKLSIEYNGEKYMLKLPEDRERNNPLQTSHVNNVISEYLGSQILASLGLEVHTTILGVYNGQLAVACKDFTEDGYRLQEFSWMMRSMYDKSRIGRIPTYYQIYDVMENHPLLKNICDTAISRYWDTFVGDALIGNFDRHKGNWGYLVNEETKDVKLAPIYDCGSCLYPNLSEEGMKEVLASKELIEERIYRFPKAALNRLNKRSKEDKFGYFELLSSDLDENCINALKRIYPRIDMVKIQDIIENTPFISDQRKEFYTKMLQYRKQLILDRSMELAVIRDIQNDSGDLIKNLLATGLFSDVKTNTQRDNSELIFILKNEIDSEIRVDARTKEVRAVSNDEVVPLIECVLRHPYLINAIRTSENVIRKSKEFVAEDRTTLDSIHNGHGAR